MPPASGSRRVFYEVEEPLEIHLSILDGVDERFETPFFDNLKKYAQKPVGTFHALPIARGKSIFNSDWIRDMGEFYGPTLFLAESSATTGGLDSLLEPTGNIKKAQDAAARAFGADHVFFVTNGTSTSNKMVVPGAVPAGRHRASSIATATSRTTTAACWRAHSRYYVEAFPLIDYSMYGACRCRRSRRRCSTSRPRAGSTGCRMLALTNVTFDGHMYDTRAGHGGVPRHQARPRLPVGRGLVRLRPLVAGCTRPRTAMGARARCSGDFADPAYLERYLAQEKKLGKDLDPKDARLLKRAAASRPAQGAHCASTRPTRRTSRCRRCARARWCWSATRTSHSTMQPFKEAVFTHASTSPNLQIIASLDVARRQMELEGYELVMRAIELALDIRRDSQRPPADVEVLPAC